ncbi:hypothetical protein CQA61_30315, partial [Klebsiella pneumoniae]
RRPYHRRYLPRLRGEPDELVPLPGDLPLEKVRAIPVGLTTGGICRVCVVNRMNWFLCPAICRWRKCA